MRNITEIQRKLIELGYPCGPDGADGKFGQNSLDAFNRFRASKGLGPVVQTSMSELNRLLFPEEQPAPAPPKKPNFFEAAGVVVTLVNILKGKAMNWDTTQQLIRIALYAGGSFFFGQQIADGQMFQAAIGGVLTVGSFIWWAINERAKKS